MGTTTNMASEQRGTAARVDHRADIYSWRGCFFERLTGEVAHGPFYPPSKKVHVDVRLDEVVLHALAAKTGRALPKGQ